MLRLVTTYLLVLVVLSLGFFGVGALASAAELADPMMPPPLAMQKFRQARLAGLPKPPQPSAQVAAPRPMRLTSILYSDERKVAIIDEQMLAVGDRIRGAELIELTRDRARLRRRGKIIDLSLGNEALAIKKKSVKGDL